MKRLLSKTGACLALLVVGTWSCVESSPFMGNTLVPPGQEMFTSITKNIGFNAYTIALDSVGTSNWSSSGYMYSGQKNSDIDGRTTVQFFGTYVPRGFNEENPDFGKTPRVDSMVLNMAFAYEQGDSLKKSLVEVYRLKNLELSPDSVYYSNFNVEPYLEDKPLVSFEIGGNTVIRKHLPVEYAKEHLDERGKDENIYYDYKKFIKKFNGLYFKVTPKEDKGALYYVSMTGANLILYYNNKNFADHPDTTLFHNMYFYGVRGTTSVQTYKHDYTLADVSKGGVDFRTINDTINPQKRVFCTGFGGLGSLIEFRTQEIEKFIKECKDKYGDKVGIGVHKAQLVWPIINNSWESMDKAFSALGLYYELNKAKFIPGFDPVTDSYQQIANTFGILNRSQGVYKMDITRYIQMALSGNKVYPKLQMYPYWYSLQYPNESVVWSMLEEDESLRPYLEITYTLVK